MKDDTPSASLGLILIGLAVFTAAASIRIRAIGLGDNHDPGARAFPVTLAAALFIGGAWELARWYRRRPASAPAAGDGGWSNRPHPHLFLLLGALAVYLPLLNWAGFSLSSFLLASSLAALLGARWWSAIAGGALLVASVKALFGILFQVDLPRGTLGLGF